MSGNRVWQYMIIADGERAAWIARCRGQQSSNEAAAKAEARRIEAMPPSHDSGMRPEYRSEYRSEYGPPSAAYWEEQAAEERAAREMEAGQRHVAAHYDRIMHGRDRDRERG